MFNLFFDEYKTDVYKKHSFKLKWYWWALIIIVVAISTLCIPVFHTEIPLACLLVAALVFAVIATIVSDNKFHKKRDFYSLKYSSDLVVPLRLLLVKRCLYTVDGIRWVLDCIMEREKEAGDSALDWKRMEDNVQNIFAAIAVFLLGVAAKEADVELTFQVTIVATVLIVALLFALWCIKHNTLRYLFNPDYRVLMAMKTDLKYILMQMENDKCQGII